MADFRWIHDDPLQNLPTISLGGPGVNALAHRWLEDVPVSLAFGDRYFIQMDPDLAEPRVSVWGMDNATTQIAVSVFIDRFLPRFLERCATTDAHLTSSEATSKANPGPTSTTRTTIDRTRHRETGRRSARAATNDRVTREQTGERPGRSD